MRQWLWLYPIVEIVHIVGFIVLVGAAFMFDLRLLGLARAVPVSALADHLLRWARWALVLVVPTAAPHRRGVPERGHLPSLAVPCRRRLGHRG